MQKCALCQWWAKLAGRYRYGAGDVALRKGLGIPRIHEGGGAIVEGFGQSRQVRHPFDADNGTFRLPLKVKRGYADAIPAQAVGTDAVERGAQRAPDRDDDSSLHARPLLQHARISRFMVPEVPEMIA